jgi:CDP-diacylglycerol--serine O-phosphatidyltransferase
LVIRVVRRRGRPGDARAPYRILGRGRSVETIAPTSPPPAGAADLVLEEARRAVNSAATREAPVDDDVPHTIPLLPGDPTLARRLKFGVANACTVGSLMLGLTAIFIAMHGSADVQWAALALLGCVIFDGLDGAVARRLGVASPFGAQMDSLADMCSFGIAAPVVVYAWLHGSAPTPVIAIACAMIAAGAAIRLARFNVSPKDGRFFCGVPTTMTAAVMGLAVLINLRLPGPVAVVAVALLAVAMVSGFPYAKLARVAKLPPPLWALPIIGLVLDYRITFALIVAGYVASGPLLWWHQRVRAATA